MFYLSDNRKALKQFNNINATPDERETIQKQVNLLKKMRHENVLHYIDFLTEHLPPNRNCNYLLTRYYKVKKERMPNNANLYFYD